MTVHTIPLVRLSVVFSVKVCKNYLLPYCATVCVIEKCQKTVQKSAIIQRRALRHPCKSLQDYSWILNTKEIERKPKRVPSTLRAENETKTNETTKYWWLTYFKVVNTLEDQLKYSSPECALQSVSKPRATNQSLPVFTQLLAVYVNM